MPPEAALTTPEMQDALGKWSGTPLDSGPKAQAYADHFILEHMNASSNGRAYSEVSTEFQTLQKDPNADPAQVAEVGELRQSLFMGSSLRGLLLSAYGWGLVGTIALWAGIAMVAIGVVLAAIGFGPLRSKGQNG